MRFLVADDCRSPAIRLHNSSLRNGLDSVVSSFAMNVGLQEAQQPLHCRIAKENYIVDATQGRHELGAIRSGQYRTARSLQTRNRSIVVHGDDKPVRHVGSALQIAHVPDVEQIEAAVGESDRATLRAIACNRCDKLGFAEYLPHTPDP